VDCEGSSGNSADRPGFTARSARVPGVSFRPVEVNGGPGTLYVDAEDGLIGVMALDIAGGEITGISSIVSPDKLKHLGPVADFAALLRAAR
jgi:hypothetical protein